jgi:DNA modification methylase
MTNNIIKKIIGNCTLYNANCEEVMPLISTVDAVVTDPPYGINESSKKIANRQRSKHGFSKSLADQKYYGEFSWDKVRPTDELISNIRSKAKYQAIFGGNYFDLPPTSCWLIWDKLNGSNDFADCEMAWTNWNKAIRKFDWLWNGMIRKNNEERFHPTQKPLELMKWVISLCPQSNVVFDPFMGSGTTGVACAKLGKKFIGVELDPKYFQIACQRIEKAYQEPDLFVSPPTEIKQEVMEL